MDHGDRPDRGADPPPPGPSCGSRPAHARLAELRDGVWGRPDNLPPEATPTDAAAVLREQTLAWSARPDRAA